MTRSPVNRVSLSSARGSNASALTGLDGVTLSAAEDVLRTMSHQLPTHTHLVTAYTDGHVVISTLVPPRRA